MNYCAAGLTIIFIISTIQWFVDGRKNYRGPQLDEGVLQTAEIAGLQVESRGQDSGEMREKKSLDMDRSS
jgi:choline transport protein